MTSLVFWMTVSSVVYFCFDISRLNSAAKKPNKAAAEPTKPKNDPNPDPAPFSFTATREPAPASPPEERVGESMCHSRLMFLSPARGTVLAEAGRRVRAEEVHPPSYRPMTP